MKHLVASLVLGALPLGATADSEKFSQDRAAILAMAGSFAVEFNFTETVPLAKGYQLKKPYQSKARELVKVIEDSGSSITLQHLLVVDAEFGPAVVKHWAQIWKYEDPRSLTYQGGTTWLPVTHGEDETKGTWTQLVTQTDDSPRYKAQGTWSHLGGSSIWTSKTSTRPLPRRDYTKRDDYDLLVVVNQHIITPQGWVHQQNNRKLVAREGRREFLCVESGLNHYRRIEDDEGSEGFAMAEDYWEKTSAFWKTVRDSWGTILEESQEPIHYAKRIGKDRLMSEIGGLARKVREGEAVDPARSQAVVKKYLR